MKRKIETVPTLGPMRPERMPKRLDKPADESPLAGLTRFMRRHFAEPTAPVRKPAT
jgi:hypothetical protein